MADRPLIVFDVNETLLDLQTMEPTFERIFGERQAMRLWFANFIMYCVIMEEIATKTTSWQILVRLICPLTDPLNPTGNLGRYLRV